MSAATQRSRDSGCHTGRRSFRRRLTRRSEMATRGLSLLVLLAASVAVIDGLDPRWKLPEGVPTPEDCLRPPMKRIGRECCSAPRERIWGDLRSSMHLCFRKFKDAAPELMRQQMDGEPGTTTPEAAEGAVSTEDPTDSAAAPGTSPRPTPEYPGHPKKPLWKKPLSERFKDLFSSVYREVKSTFDALWQSVVIITDHFRRHPKDSCFMECVFEDQGFLANKLLNKEALLRRLSDSLRQNEPWHKAAVAAFETCYAGLQVPANGTCQSGSEEIFRCTFKQLFFNCPNWAQTEYCTALKDFYQKCPNGPPPETPDVHTTMPPEEDAESPVTTERDTQGQ